MKILDNVQKKRLFMRFMISYIIMLGIPLSASLFVYQQSVGVVKKDALEANLSLLEQSKYIIDKGLNQVTSLSLRLTLDTRLKALLYKKGNISTSDVNTLYEIYCNMPSKAQSGDLVKNYYVVLPGINTVLNYESSYNLHDFYNWVFKFGDMNYEKWDQSFLKEYHNKKILPAENAIINGETDRIITYLQSMPIEIYKQSLGVVMILIDEEEVIKSLEKINTDGGGNVYIIDADGKLIAAKNGNINLKNVKDILKSKSPGYSECKVNGKDMLYSYTTSSYYGWTYVAELPSSVVLQRVNYIRTITLVAILLCFIIGLLAAYFMSYRNIKPIKDIVKLLSTRISGVHSEALEDYNYLRSAVSSLIENDIELSQRLEQNIPLAQAVFLQRLIKGELISQDELETNMQQVRLDLHGLNYNVLAVHVRGYYGIISKEALQELNAIKEIIRNYDWTADINGHAVDIDDSTVSFIMVYQNSSNADCIRILEKAVFELGEFFTKKYNIQLDFAAGNHYISLTDIYCSLNEARYTLEYGESNNSNEVSWYNNIHHDEWVYYFPIDIEQRLINLIKAGNRKETEKILDAVYRENFEKYNISYDMVNNLFSEMRGTIFKVVSQIYGNDKYRMIEIYNILKELKHGTRAPEAYELIRNAFLYICDMVDNKKHSQNTKLKEEIVGFIGNNYMNPDMCLTYVATRFDLSEVYLSNFFKEQVGENFLEYIEGLRIKTACELIMQCKLSIEEIALKIGYNSPHAFRRAFKRCKGVPPTDLRKLQ